MQSDLPRLLHPDTSPSHTRRPHCPLPRLSELDNYQRSSAPGSSIHPRPPPPLPPPPDSHRSPSPPRAILPLTPPPTSSLHSPPATTSSDAHNSTWSSTKPPSHRAAYPRAHPSSANPRAHPSSANPNDALPPPIADQSSHPDNMARPPPPIPILPPSTSQTQTSSLSTAGQNGPHPSHPSSQLPPSLCLARVQDHSLPPFAPFKTPARPTTPPSHPSSDIPTAPPQSSSHSSTVAPPNGIPPASHPPRYSTPPSPAQTPKAAPKARHHSDRPPSHMVRFVGRSNSAEAMPPPSSPSQWTPDRPENICSNPPRISTMAVSSSSILALDNPSNPKKPTTTNPQQDMTTFPSLHAPRDGRTLGSLVTVMCDQCKVKPVDGTDAFVMQCGPYAHSLRCPDCQAKEAGETDYPNRTQSNKRKSPPPSSSSSDPLEDQSSSKARKVTPDRPPSTGRELGSLATSRPSDPEGRLQLTISEANEIFHLLIKSPETAEEISQDRQLHDTVYKLGPPQADRLNGTCHPR